MPNHITNRIFAPQHVIAALVGPKEFVDFNQIIPAPKHEGDGWYNWNCENWGTKWNAYDCKQIDGGVQFDTAWSAPRPVIEKLSQMFPDVKIEHLWADEDIGYNFGHEVYKKNCIVVADIEDGVDFALNLKEYMREYYRKNLKTGKWEYFDADEQLALAE